MATSPKPPSRVSKTAAPAKPQPKPAKPRAKAKAKPKAKATAARPGRPSIFTPELAESICERIAQGQSSRQVCKELAIDDSTLFRWLKQDDQFKEQYAHARERQADLYAGQIVEISDEIVIEATYKGEEVTLDVSSTAVARNRLRVDSRKWLASKLAPKKYGDKLQVGGAEDLPALKHDLSVTLSPADAYRQLLEGGN